MKKALIVSALSLAFATAGRACDLRQAVEAGQKLLSQAKPRTEGSASYYPVIRRPDGEEVAVVSKRPPVDYRRREIPIAVLDLRDCSVTVFRPWREIRSHRVSEPLGVPGLRLEPRVPGPAWNGKNSPFVFADPYRVVVGEAWKEYGSGRVHIYAPHSWRLHYAFPEAEQDGRAELDRIVERAMLRLRSLGYLEERLFPRFRRLMPYLVRTEHMDQEEFQQGTDQVRRLLAAKPAEVLFANGAQGLIGRKSSAGAKGIAQVEPRTCRDLRERFPRMRFSRDCNGADGLDSQTANLAAGILVVRMKDKQLYPVFGEALYASVFGDLVSGAAYNGGIVRALAAIGRDRAAWTDVRWTTVRVREGRRVTRKMTERADSLRRETSIYVRKMEYLMRLDAPSKPADIAGGG